MNAAEQATSVELTGKIATIVHLFKAQFPDARADLKPWSNDQNTREQADPDSIDLGFHLPGWSRLFQSRSILVQIRFHPDRQLYPHRVIGLDTQGFDHRGERWRLSTVADWQFVGTDCPDPSVRDRLKAFCCHVFDLFNGSQ